MSVRRAKYGTPIVLAMLLAGFAARAENQSESAAQIERAYKDAVEQRLEGDLRGAATTLGQLVLVAPDNPRILGEYGKVLVAQGRADDALAFLRRSAQIQPNDWTVYSAMGVAFDQKANYKSAKIAYDRALTLKPGEPSILSNAGVSRMLAGDLDDAEQMLVQASVVGKDPKIAKNLALVRSLKASAPTQIASPPKVAPVKQASVAPAPAVATARPMPAPAPVVADTQATASVVASTPAPTKTVVRTYDALKMDPTVRMAPIPREEVAAEPAPTPRVAVNTPAVAVKATAAAKPAPHVAVDAPTAKATAPAPVKAVEAKSTPQATPQAAPHVLPQAPTTQVATPAKPAPTPVATAAPQPLVKVGALKVEKTAAKESPKPAAKTPAPVKAAEAKPAAPVPAPAKAVQAKLAAATAPVKAAANAPAATAPAKPAAKVAETAKEPAKPVVITGKPKTPPVETAMLRPTVTDVTPVAATAHKNSAPQND